MGHSVSFAGDGAYMRLPREAGFRTVPLVSVEPEYTLRVARAGRVRWWTRRSAEEHIRAEITLLERERPDAVLCDNRFTASTSCEVVGVPMISLLNASWTNYYAVRYSAPEHFPITHILGERLTEAIIPALKRVVLTVDVLPVRRVRRQLGLPRRKNLWDIGEGALNLLVDVPSFAPTTNLPSHHHYIGPIVWEPALELPAWYHSLDPERPTVYISMGSTGNPKYLQAAVDVLGNTEYQCMMTTAGLMKFESLPSNFFVTEYASGMKLIEKADAVVCQGGNGTIYQALTHGVPIVGIPTMHDQEFNMDRVEALGAGIQLSDLRFRPQHLTEALRRVLHEPVFRAAARRVGEEVCRYNGARQAAEEVEDFLKGVGDAQKKG